MDGMFLVEKNFEAETVLIRYTKKKRNRCRRKDVDKDFQYAFVAFDHRD